MRLQQVTRELALSQTHLERLSNREFSCSMMELFHRMKINRACSLLTDRSKTINEVALHLGYQDPAYFAGFSKEKCR